MADDLVERLRIKADMIHLGETIAWGSDVALMHEAVARITDLEARLAVAEAGVQRAISGWDKSQEKQIAALERAEAAEAALAESEAAAEGALMILVQTQAERDAALAQVARAHETAPKTPWAADHTICGIAKIADECAAMKAAAPPFIGDGRP